jgi:L-fucose mutarotase
MNSFALNQYTPVKRSKMLKGISKYLSPELLALLHQMGHGDEIVLADAHFPGHTIARRILRADGITVVALLDGIMPLFELDSYSPPLIMMEILPGDTADPSVESDYMGTIRKFAPKAEAPQRLERQAFYERAKDAFAVVITGESRKYGNLLLKKGVTPTD